MRLPLRQPRCRWRPQPGGSSVDVYNMSHLTKWVGEEKPPHFTTTSPEIHQWADRQQNHMISYYIQTWSIWIFSATQTTDVTLDLSWEMLIWWEWAQSLGSWILFSCMCVEKKKKKTEEEVVEEKSLETFAATFNPQVCFVAKLKSTRRKNTQDQHIAGKLVFHVASSCDVQWYRRYVHSSGQRPARPMSTVHWRFLLGNKVHSFDSVSWL